MSVVTRFAPSPTGMLHLGGARTALFNWLYARHHGGSFRLRLEDTDRKRSTPEALAAIIDGLTWLGLEWDGEIVRQSERRQRHFEVAHGLLAAGGAYRCYCTPEELEAMRAEARAQGRTALYDGRWRNRDEAEAPPGVAPVIRFRAPQEGNTIISDLVQRDVQIDNSALDDMVLLRADGTPTYMLSVVVDDHDMGITHAIRGDDHLTNAFRQTQLFRALGWEPPAYAHIPLIHGPDGAKLSKRHGAVAVGAYAELGVLPAAMRNALLRLGWSHGDDEIIDTAQAIAWFDLDAVNRGAARFDMEKLLSLNGHYIRESADSALLAGVEQRLAARHPAAATDEGRRRIAALLLEAKARAKTLLELADNLSFLVCDRPIAMTPKAARLLGEGDSEARARLGRLKAALQDNAAWDESALEGTVRGFVRGRGRQARRHRAAAQGGVDGCARVARDLRCHGCAGPGGDAGPLGRRRVGNHAGHGGRRRLVGGYWRLREERTMTDDRVDLAITGAHLWREEAPRDLFVDGGRFVAPPPGGAAAAERTIDAGGRLCVTGFLEPHIHLDKAQINDDVRPNRSGTLDEAIEIIWERKRAYTVEEIAARATRTIRSAVAHGVTRFRSHVDVDSIGGLRPLEGVLEARERTRDIADFQIVAFPQEGIFKDKGTDDLMWKAMEAGADLVGGMPFNEATPAESARHIALAFEIAAHHDADIDMHVDETDDPDAKTLEVLAEQTMAQGWQGRVTAGHTCALAGYEEDYANRVIGLVRDAGIHMIANPATNLMLQGRGDAQPKRRGITRVKELLEAGVNVSCGQDCIRDPFYPFGRGDPLEVMFLASHAAHMSRPHEIETVFDMQTGAAARTMGLTDYGAEPGCVADLVIIDAADPLEALTRRADRTHVIKRGRVVAETVTQRRTAWA